MATVPLEGTGNEIEGDLCAHTEQRAILPFMFALIFNTTSCVHDCFVEPTPNHPRFVLFCVLAFVLLFFFFCYFSFSFFLFSVLAFVFRTPCFVCSVFSPYAFGLPSVFFSGASSAVLSFFSCALFN